MPPIIPDYDTSLAQTCNKIFEQVIGHKESESFPIKLEDVKKLTADQLIYFLQKILENDALSIKKLEAIDSVFGFSKVKNAEIKFRWLRIGLKAHWPQIVNLVLEWVSEVGRMKFVRPLYRDLYAWEEVRPQAIANFESTKKSMMHVVAYTVSKDLHLV